VATPKHGLTSNTKRTLPMSTKTGTSNSPTLEQLRLDIFVAIEMLNGYTEAEALMNYECTQGTCQCP